MCKQQLIRRTEMVVKLKEEEEEEMDQHLVILKSS
jgi:hypothetical protein